MEEGLITNPDVMEAPDGRMMERRDDFLVLLEELFHLPDLDYTQYSPLTLAYIGDAVYDLVIRTILVRRTNMQTTKLHRRTTSFVNAKSQAELARKILPLLTEEETGVFRRGHNAKPEHTAKNAGREDYLTATGFEALIGYLYLEKRFARMLALIEGAADL